MPAPASRRVTPMWLAHHWPEDYDRCVRIGRSHVCRRCLVLYPVALAVAAVALLVGSTLPSSVTAVAVVLLPLPAVVEFVAEHLGRITYSPRRQVAVTVPLAVGLGAGFARYLAQLTDPWFWGAVAAYGGACLLAALSGRRGVAEPQDER